MTLRRRSASVILALLLLSGCSSKNPDSLIGMNIDEGPASTSASDEVEAPEATDAEAAPAPTSAAKEVTAADRKQEEASDEETAAQPNASDTDADSPERELNPVDNDTESPPGDG